VLRSARAGKRRLVAALLLGLGVVAAGAGGGGKPVPASPQAPPVPAAAGKDLHGDPLPPGALARLGTARQRASEASVAVTADGKEVVTVGPDLTVRRFDAATGSLRATLQLPRERSPQVWLSPRGTYALTTAFRRPAGNLLEVWELATGKCVRELPLGNNQPWGAAFAPDERRVAVADSGYARDAHRVVVWDFGDDKSRVLWSLSKETRGWSYEPFVAWSPDGGRLLSWHLDEILRCWNVLQDQPVWQSPKPNTYPFAFFSADGRTVFTRARGYDAATGREAPPQHKLPGEPLFQVGASPDGRFLVLQTLDDGVVLWDPGTGKVAHRFASPHRPEGWRGPIPHRAPTDFAFTPDSKGFVRRASALQRWDLATGRSAYPDTETWGHTGEVTRLVFSPDGRRLATASAKDKTARLWDVAAGRALHTFPKGLSDHLAFSPSGRQLLATPPGALGVVGNPALRAWDVATGRQARVFDLADPTQFMPTGNDRELRVTADGRKVLMLTRMNGGNGFQSVLSAWDLNSGRCLDHRRVPWGEDSLLTPDGSGVLALGESGAVRQLDLDTGKERVRFESDRVWDAKDRQESPWGCDLALSPDGRLAAARVRYYDRDVPVQKWDALRVYDAASGRQLAKLPADGPAVFAFSADGRLFASADRGAVRLWETAGWKELGTLPAAGVPVPTDRPCASSLAFAPDGRTLATGHADGTVLLWDATLRSGRGGGALTAGEADRLWADLAGADAPRAFSAACRLADDPARSVPFLAGRLRPVEPPPAAAVRALLDELDSDRFAAREVAQEKLREFGEAAGPALRAALAADSPAERRRRVKALLAELGRPGPPAGEARRGLWAVPVLERAGTPEARDTLARLAGGVESARLTVAAKEALARLGN
jgi:WD40 repeat protein